MLSGGYLCLIDPYAKRLGRDVQVAGCLRYGILLITGVNQPDCFLLELPGE
jgi:hypothetical protein